MAWGVQTQPAASREEKPRGTPKRPCARTRRVWGLTCVQHGRRQLYGEARSGVDRNSLDSRSNSSLTVSDSRGALRAFFSYGRTNAAPAAINSTIAVTCWLQAPSGSPVANADQPFGDYLLRRQVIGLSTESVKRHPLSKVGLCGQPFAITCPGCKREYHRGTLFCSEWLHAGAE